MHDMNICGIDMVEVHVHRHWGTFHVQNIKELFLCMINPDHKKI